MKKGSALLISGGLDSAILLSQLLKKFRPVHPIYVSSNHLWEKTELFWLHRFLGKIKQPGLAPLICLSLPTNDLYKNHWSQNGRRIPGARSRDEEVYLPGKNLMLIAKASVYCALNHVPNLALGPLKTNPFPDANPRFFRSIARTASGGLDFKLTIRTPFLKRTKKEVMRLGRHLPLELTFSCLSPKGRRHCGRCNKCAERKKAFRQAGLIDKTTYAALGARPFQRAVFAGTNQSAEQL